VQRANSLSRPTSCMGQRTTCELLFLRRPTPRCDARRAIPTAAPRRPRLRLCYSHVLALSRQYSLQLTNSSSSTAQSALATAVAAVTPSILDNPRMPPPSRNHDPAALARLKRQKSRARLLSAYTHTLKRKRRVNLSLSIPLPTTLSAYKPCHCNARSFPISPAVLTLHKSLPLTPESEAASSSAPSLYRSSTRTSISTDYPPELFAPRPHTPSNLKRLTNLAPSFKWQRKRPPTPKSLHHLALSNASFSSPIGNNDAKLQGGLIPWPLARQKPKRALTAPPSEPSRPLDRHAVSLAYVSMALEERRQAAL
jgi:hypothetical protein